VLPEKLGNISRLNGVGVMQELLDNHFAEKNQTLISGLTWARN
jgi:hypothetical protein